MSDSMYIKEMIDQGQKQLEEAGIEDAASCAKLLCCYVLGVSAGQLPLMYGEKTKETGKYRELIGRKASGEPLQYIIGEVEFMGLPFRADERALIPRPETELLVEEALKVLEEKIGNSPYAVCDLCCGSGAIGLSLASLWESKAPDRPDRGRHPDVTLTDVSPRALSLARENAEALGLADKIVFLQGDLMDPMKDLRFDLIVSNPPYIPSAEIDLLQREVRDHEPRLALDGGGDGLDIYRKIIGQAPEHLYPGGVLLMEIGADQAEEIKKLIRKEEAFAGIEVIKDLAGLDRIVKIYGSGIDKV